MSAIINSNIFIVIIMAFVFPQAFFAFKLPFLTIALLGITVNAFQNKYKIYSGYFVSYYLVIFILTTCWALIGLINGNSAQAVGDALRLFIAYGFVHMLLTIHISQTEYNRYLDIIFCLGALGIFGFALYTYLNAVFSLNFLPDRVLDEMYMQVGFHKGYIQLNNINIGMLAMILPYIVSRLIISQTVNKALMFGLVFSLIASGLASRRSIFLLFLLAPIITLLTVKLSGLHHNYVGARVMKIYLIILAIVFLTFFWMYKIDREMLSGLLERLFSAFVFGEENIRYVQNENLMHHWAESPILGSGFGGLIDVVRAKGRPWNFETTYTKLLFNAGLVGTVLLVSSFLFHLKVAIDGISSHKDSQFLIPLIVAFLSISVAAITNPFFSSFDFLISLSIIPLVINSKVLKNRGGSRNMNR